MRKQILTVVLILALAVVALADNVKRIEELKGRQAQIIAEIDQRQVAIQQQSTAIDGLRAEYLKTQGAIEELQRQDAAAKQAEKK